MQGGAVDARTPMSADSSAKTSHSVRPSASAEEEEIPPSSSRPPRRPASKCPCCGRRGLRPTREPGRALRYRHMCLTLPADLPVPTCRLCRHQVLTFESVPELESTLAALFRAELVHRASVEITYLGRYYSQRRLEREIDLSQGYLSRLRSGDGVPSVALVCLLALLGNDPRRLEELNAYWALPLPVEPSPSKRNQDA